MINRLSVFLLVLLVIGGCIKQAFFFEAPSQNIQEHDCVLKIAQNFCESKNGTVYQLSTTALFTGFTCITDREESHPYHLTEEEIKRCSNE